MKLIINADDFGLSKSITDGIIDGIKEGVLTSTSIMANMDFAEYAVKRAIEEKIDCVGLHVNLTVGKPIVPNPHLAGAGGAFWYNRKQIDDNKSLTYEDCQQEIKAQVAKVEKFGNGKLKLDHLDTHHILQDNKVICKAIQTIAKQMKLPTRKEGYAKGNKSPDVLVFGWTIENVTLEKLEGIIEKYKNTDLVVELVTHSGYVDDYTKSVTSYVGRENELNVLRSAKEKGLFEGIELISFSDLRR